MTIKDIQENAKQLAPIFWDKTPEQRMLYLTTEIGELAKEVLKLQGSQGDNKEVLEENLGMEIYDIVWNLCDLANMFDIDLEESFARKIELNNNRWESLRAEKREGALGRDAS